MLSLRMILRFPLLITFMLFAQHSFSCEEKLSSSEQKAIAHRIYLNECNGNSACLVDWNPGEDFPSLGIGHFIWYPKHVDPGYVESFPLLIDYIKQNPIELPAWITQLEPFDAPWPDRAAFQKQRDSDAVRQLRNFLERHQDIQIAFMQQRMQQSLQKIRARLEPAQRQPVQHNIDLLCQSVAGQYALIDYVNFKGEGLSEGERVNGEGWGLMQVLMQMQSGTSPLDALKQFALAADIVLSRRALNSPNPELQKQWLSGWRKRIQTYVHFQLP